MRHDDDDDDGGGGGGGGDGGGDGYGYGDGDGDGDAPSFDDGDASKAVDASDDRFRASLGTFPPADDSRPLPGMGVAVPRHFASGMHVPIKVQSLDQEHAAVLPVHAMVEAIRGVPVPLHETSDAPRDGDGDGVSSP